MNLKINSLINLMELIIYNSFLVFGIHKLFLYNYECTSRIASLSHAWISLIGSILFINNLIDYYIFEYVIHYNIIYISTDIYLYLTQKVSNKDIVEMMIHHIFFLIASYISYINPYYYAYGIMSEGSTIFLNKRWFSINNYFLNYSKYYEIMFWITFLLFRIINFTYLAFNILNSELYYCIIILLPFLILNYTWFYKLTKNLFLK